MATIKEALPEELKYLDAIREQVTKASADRSETGRIASASLRGQEQIQNLFVQVGEALQKGKLNIFSYRNMEEYDGTYKGNPVKISIDAFALHNRDNSRGVFIDNELEITLTDPDSRAVISDITLRTDRNDSREQLGMSPSYSWKAESIDYPEGWKRGDGGGDRPMTKQNDVLGKDGIEGFENRNGMSENLHELMLTMSNFMEGVAV